MKLPRHNFLSTLTISSPSYRLLMAIEASVRVDRPYASSSLKLPVELFVTIFALAAHESFSSAYALALVSRWSRVLVLPELYSVVVVEGARLTDAAASMPQIERWVWRLKTFRALGPSESNTEEHGPSDETRQAVLVTPWKHNTILLPLDAHQVVRSLFITASPSVLDKDSHHMHVSLSSVEQPSNAAYDQIMPLQFQRLNKVHRLFLTNSVLHYLHAHRDGFGVRAGEALFPELSEIQLFEEEEPSITGTITLSEIGLPHLKACGVRLDRLTHVFLPGAILHRSHAETRTFLSRIFAILPSLTHFSYGYLWPRYARRRKVTGRGGPIDATPLVNALPCAPSTLRFFVLRTRFGSQKELDELVQATNDTRLLVMQESHTEKSWASWASLSATGQSFWDEALRLRQDYVKGSTFL